MSYNTAHPHIASYMLLKKDGKVAFVLRSHTSWMNGYYGLPSGKVEKGEPYLQAAVREAKEEAGVTIKEEDLQPVLTVHRYDSSSNVKDWVDVYFEASQWTGEPHNAEPHKHSELIWMDTANLPKNVIPSVRYSLSEIEAGKHYAEYGWDKVVEGAK